MNLEEIAERLQDWPEVDDGDLLEDIEAAIRERNATVSRKWVISCFGDGENEDGLGRTIWWFGSEGFALELSDDTDEAIFSFNGNYILHVDTKGQLLDLLSGLGVQK